MNAPCARVEEKHLEGLWLCTEDFRKHDPNGIIKEHYRMVTFSKAYQHDQSPFDIIFQGAETYEEFLEKIRNIEENQEREKLLVLQEKRRKREIE